MSCRKPTRLTGGLIALSCLVVGAAAVPARSVPAPLSVPQGTWETIDKIYSFDLEQAAEGAQKMQRELPEHPLGYLLEDEALWWRFWCTSADYKWGMMDARHRPHAPSDARYLELSTKAYSLARREIARGDSAEMQLYAGMADALAARLYALRGENRSTARVSIPRGPC